MDSLTITRLLAAIVRGDAVSSALWREVSVDAFCAAAVHHGVLPLVAERLRDQPSEPPADIVTAVRDLARAHAAADLITEVELRVVVAAIDAAGLDPIVFKGAHLAYVDYARPDLRPRVDTDLLIPARVEARRHAHVVLTGLGYESPPHVGGDFVMTQRSYVKRRAGRVVHAVDVHWRIANPQAFARVLVHEEILRDAAPVPRIGPSARGPSGPHALLIACIHRVAHHADSDCLIWLVDIDRLARRIGDDEWARFAALAAERRVAAVCGRSLQRAADVFGTPLPDRVLASFVDGSRDRATADFLSVPPDAAHAAIRDLRAIGSLGDRARFTREHLMPPAEYMRQVYAPGSRAPLVWLYLKRIIGGASTRIRRRPARTGDAGASRVI